MSATMRTGTAMSTDNSTVSVVTTAVTEGKDATEEEPIVAVESKVKVHTPPTFANTYAAKKTVAQGMMDIALITSNANQLRYLLEFGNRQTTTFYMAVVFIAFSLLLQLAVGICLIFKGRFDLGGEAKMVHANRLNNYVVVAVFLVTVINVFVAAFSIDGTSASTASSVATANVAIAPIPVPDIPAGELL